MRLRGAVSISRCASLLPFSGAPSSSATAHRPPALTHASSKVAAESSGSGPSSFLGAAWLGVGSGLGLGLGFGFGLGLGSRLGLRLGLGLGSGLGSGCLLLLRPRRLVRVAAGRAHLLQLHFDELAGEVGQVAEVELAVHLRRRGVRVRLEPGLGWWSGLGSARVCGGDLGPEFGVRVRIGVVWG